MSTYKIAVIVSLHIDLRNPFPGYNFPSLESITPYLEPVGEGRSGKWARETATRLKCKVCVGYPEIEGEKHYNSLLVVDENGKILVNYRKSFLYYTDVSWASEGDPERGFCTLTLGRNNLATSFGVCMDINPYRFEAPFTAWEFANRVLDSRSELVIVSMAWLTMLSREELDMLSNKPDMDTFQYWIRRFWPLLEKKMNNKRVIIVFSNRAGEEAGGSEPTPIARYAGTSAIIAITQKPDEGQASFDVKILCWDIMGATQEGICFADMLAEPRLVFGLTSN